MRRKRVETYFALYLAAIISFLVVASERDKVEEELRTKNEKILAAFLRSAPVEPERDTLYWNVDADDRTGVIRSKGIPFQTFIRIRDIRAEDSVSLAIQSVKYENELLSNNDVVKIKNYYQDPNTSLPVVLFPLECSFSKTGVYNVALQIQTNRIHQTASGELKYSDFTFSSDLIDKSKRESVEHSATAFTVIVVDTSANNPIAVEQIAINVARQKIVSAIGFEESNEIFVNLPGTKPNVKIVYGSGAIDQRVMDNGDIKYFWKGIVRSTPDSVVIEAKVARGAGGKDVARAQFYVMANEPYLIGIPPTDAYTGEEIEMSIQVEGLNNAAQYSWNVQLRGEKKASGNSPLVKYLVPSGSENAELIINGYYDGKPFRCVSKRNNRNRESSFSYKVQRPPAHVFFNPPNEVNAFHIFSFDAVRFGRAKKINEKPIGFNEIDIQVVSEDGANIPIDRNMIEPGSYEFRFRNPTSFIKKSQNVTITIHAAEAMDQDVVRVIKK